MYLFFLFRFSNWLADQLSLKNRGLAKDVLTLDRRTLMFMCAQKFWPELYTQLSKYICIYVCVCVYTRGRPRSLCLVLLEDDLPDDLLPSRSWSGSMSVLQDSSRLSLVHGSPHARRLGYAPSARLPILATSVVSLYTNWQRLCCTLPWLEVADFLWPVDQASRRPKSRKFPLQWLGSRNILWVLYGAEFMIWRRFFSFSFLVEWNFWRRYLFVTGV